MSFDIVLKRNNSENICMTKDTNTIGTYTGTLRQETSIIDPVFVVECSLSDVKYCNYLTVSSFGRSYFVKDITSKRNGLVEFTCHVDALSSFASEIKANKGIFKRSENSDAYNLYLNDGSFKFYQNPKMLTKEFPNGFTAQEFVLAVAGS